MKVIPYYPQTKAGLSALAQRISTVQATFAKDRLKTLTCPKEQKAALLKAILETSRQLEAKDPIP